MAAVLSRRDLVNRMLGGAPVIRPPWSLRDEIFTERCTVCGDCLDGCPTGLLVKGRAGYPIADFSQGTCTFCGACADACKADCFTADRTLRPWSVRAVVSTACVEAKGVSCRMCEETCAVSAISFKPAMGGRSNIQISQASCTGCGACLRACPVAALSMAIGSDEVPA